MSAGAARRGPIDQDRERELRELLDNPEFAKAVSAYHNEDDTKDIPYLGGSDTEGTTVFFDRAFASAIKSGQVKIDGKPIDPRPALKVHESVEGAEIRLLHYDYTKAHDIATIAEQHAVAHLGWDWDKYEDALKPFIRGDESETIHDPPSNLLLAPYEGTPLLAKIKAAQGESTMAMTPRQQFDAKVAAGRPMTGGMPATSAPPMPGPMAPMPSGPMPGAPPAPAAPPMGAPVASPLPPNQALLHGRAIAGAKALHQLGHISEAQRDKHVGKSMKALRKPFGSFAPVGR